MSFQLPPHQLRAVIWVTRAFLAFACLLFAYLAVSQGPPTSPDGPGLERDIQYGFLVIGLLGAFIAWFRILPGGMLLLFTGIALGVAAAGRYSEATALGVALLFAGPGALLLLLSISGRSLFIQLSTLALIAGAFAAGGDWAIARHSYAFDPAHPSSPLTRQPVDRVEWVWSGGVTDSSAIVSARLAAGVRSARLVAATDATFSQPLFSGLQTVVDESVRVVSLRIDGLEPGRRYYYAVEADGKLDAGRRGSLRTFPRGAASFTIAFSSCARTGSNGAVFDTIRGHDPLLYVVTGDFHYDNITRNDRDAFRSTLNKILTAPAQAALYQETPIAYVWDDHDFGGNNSDASSDARSAARLTYREYVPHYALPAGEGNAAIYQAFSIGRVRFILTDTRSERNAEKLPDGSDSLLGSRQRLWLEQELLQASRSHALVVWVNSDPWIAPADSARDDWGGYASERREIAGFIAANQIDNLLMLSGDAHMLAIDDGSNSDYAPAGGAAFPVFHAAALDRPGSTKGGPFSEGAYPGAGQFGLVSIDDDGSTLNVRLSGRNWLDEEIVTYSFQVSAPVSAAAPSR